MPKAIRNGDMVIHDDWYQDGCDSDEQLWRMDFAVGDDEFQVQLFANVAKSQLDDDDHIKSSINPEDELYVSFRLFLERDNRDTIGTDDSFRVDYACGGELTKKAEAIRILQLSQAELPGAIAKLVSKVAALPNDLDYCHWDDRHHDYGDEDIAAYYKANTARWGSRNPSIVRG